MSRTIEFFYEIAKIPRESGNETQISEYLCAFAKKRDLFYVKDEYNNVIIKKKNADKEPIILQAHTDMICEKEDGLDFDFSKDSINVYEENGVLRARGTTLGADNGIGIAQVLNILDDDNIKCNVEAVFTATEETTMIGAEKIDVSLLEAKKMINLDGFEDNTIIKESVSFFDILIRQNYSFEKLDESENKDVSLNIYEIILKGLKGGHSGFDIGKNRGNSAQELAYIVKDMKNIRLIDFVAGSKFNVIPSTGKCTFISTNSLQNVENRIKNYLKEKRKIFEKLEAEVKQINGNCKLKEVENITYMDNLNSLNYLNSIINFAHGVYRKNSREEITTSINLGACDLRNQIFKVGMRSSKKREEKECLEYINDYASNNSYSMEILGSQPGFETKSSSDFIKLIKDSYKRVDKEDKLKVKSVHITVEAGFFKDKIEDLEIAIISPKIENAHTVEECVEIESVNKCDNWIRYIIEGL